MKKTILLVAVAALTLASCTKEQNTNNGDSLTPISLTGSATSIDGTRAVVNPGDAFTAQIVGSAATASYATTLFSQSTTFAATTGATTLTPVQYYNADAAITTYIKGYAPTSGALASGVVTFTTDGTQDIMVSNEVSGTKSNATTKAMTFSHLLTQLQFKVIAQDQAAIDAWGNVTAIEVLAQPSVFTLALSGSTLSAGTTPITFTPLNAGNIALTTTAASTGTPCMIKPVAAAGTVSLKVYTVKNTTGMTVTATAPAGGFAISTAHEITLTFKATAITVSGSVGTWIDGTDQNIDLQ